MTKELTKEEEQEINELDEFKKWKAEQKQADKEKEAEEVDEKAEEYALLFNLAKGEKLSIASLNYEELDEETDVAYGEFNPIEESLVLDQIAGSAAKLNSVFSKLVRMKEVMSQLEIIEMYYEFDVEEKDHLKKLAKVVFDLDDDLIEKTDKFSLAFTLAMYVTDHKSIVERIKDEVAKIDKRLPIYDKLWQV